MILSLRWFFAFILFGSIAALSAPVYAAASNTKADEQAGALLFRDKGCAYCHGLDLAGTVKAPALADVRKDKNWTPAKMTNQILNGGQKMPPFKDSLTDEEIAKLVAFLRAKNRPVVAPAEGGSPAPAALPK